MTEKPPKPPKEPRPSPINGPAFLVFGIIFLLLGLGTDMRILVWPAMAFLLIAWFGFRLQRRYEKEIGFEETLPGKSPERSERPEVSEPAESAEPAEEPASPEPPELDR